MVTGLTIGEDSVLDESTDHGRWPGTRAGMGRRERG